MVVSSHPCLTALRRVRGLPSSDSSAPCCSASFTDRHPIPQQPTYAADNDKGSGVLQQHNTKWIAVIAIDLSACSEHGVCSKAGVGRGGATCYNPDMSCTLSVQMQHSDQKTEISCPGTSKWLAAFDWPETLNSRQMLGSNAKLYCRQQLSVIMYDSEHKQFKICKLSDSSFVFPFFLPSLT